MAASPLLGSTSAMRVSGIAARAGRSLWQTKYGNICIGAAE